MRQSAAARSTIGTRLSRVWRNWLLIVGRSPGGATAFPPNATTIVPDGTAAQPSGAGGPEQAGAPALDTSARTPGGSRPRERRPPGRPGVAPAPSAPRG